MSFKKTVTFTASVSDYTDGTVSARVQAENKILGDLVTFILAQNLGISIQEKVEIGSSKWSGEPFYCSTSGATTDVNNNSLSGDFYCLGRGITKKCLGVSLDSHSIYISLTDTPTHDLTFPGNLGNYGRIPCLQMRKIKSNLATRTNYFSSVPLVTFPTNTNDLSLTIDYWKNEKNLIIKSDIYEIIISKDPATAMITSISAYKGIHFSFDDDFMISLATYSYSANNSNYASNVNLGYAMSYSPFFAKSSGSSIWSSPASESGSCTCILSHRYGGARGIISSIGDFVDSDARGLEAAGNNPTTTAFLFPRIANNELYIKKWYVPMTYPAVASPVKIGYTPGKLNAGNIYNLNNKNYLCLTNGVIGLFVEVEDQGD